MSPLGLEVWGDYACFTRPEMKVERVSYDVITPSAARGIFEAVLWKPEFRWRIVRIEVVNPIRWISVRRNELGSVISPRRECCFIEEERQQRAGLFLRDVRYRVYASLELMNSHGSPNQSSSNKAGDGDLATKYREMFIRRAQKGQCYHRPYLGCRECAAHFRWIEGGPSESSQRDLWREDRDFGWMLYDLDYSGTEVVPMFFRAVMKQGVIAVPSPESDEVRR